MLSMYRKVTRPFSQRKIAFSCDKTGSGLGPYPMHNSTNMRSSGPALVILSATQVTVSRQSFVGRGLSTATLDHLSETVCLTNGEIKGLGLLVVGYREFGGCA
jgi:hypothetical protein